jgi:hypothetical protein
MRSIIHTKGQYINNGFEVMMKYMNFEDVIYYNNAIGESLFTIRNCKIKK